MSRKHCFESSGLGRRREDFTTWSWVVRWLGFCTSKSSLCKLQHLAQVVGRQHGDRGYWVVSPTRDLGLDVTIGFASPLCLRWGAHEQYLGNILNSLRFKTKIMGLPWWHSGWESACQCRGHGFEPWSGKIPHAAERLGPWATIAEPARLEPVLRNKRGRDSERPTHCGEEWPPLAATGESPHTETKTQHSHK